MLVKDLLKELQELYPHIPQRLSREGDPELSTVLIHFFPKAMTPKKIKPPERSDNGLDPGNEQTDVKPTMTEEESLLPEQDNDTLTDDHREWQRKAFGKKLT